jgi:Phosphodiester glycosidase/S-layer homology domain
MTNDQFRDVTNHWARLFIQGLRSRNLVSGFPDGSFRPNNAMNRAEYAAILNKSLPRPAIRPYEPFVDFSPQYWAAEAIKKAFEAGFLSGFPNRRFRPLDPVTRVQVLVSLVTGLKIAELVEENPNAKPLAEIYEDAAEIPNYAKDEIEVATRAGLVVNHPNLKRFNPNQAATRAEVSAFIYQALVFLGQIPLVESEFIFALPSGLIRQGSTIILNDRARSMRWGQWRVGASLRTGIRDSDARESLGIELFNTNDATKQPIAWFSNSTNLVGTRLEGSDRLLDLTDFIFTANWQIQASNSTLSLKTPENKLTNIMFQEQPTVARVVLDCTPLSGSLRDRGTPWQLQQPERQWILTLDGEADPATIDRFRSAATQGNPNTNAEATNEGETGGSVEKPKPPIAQSKDKQITLTGNLPEGLGIRISTRDNQLLLELRPDALVDRDLLWTTGLRWQQRYLSLASDRFPVTWLTCDRRAPHLLLRPIWTDPQNMKGTEPLLQMAEKWQVLAAINAGFFNRQTLLPLGAIRWQSQWFSGPILNRGAIAWDDSGNFAIDRLTLNETLTNQYGKTFPVLFLNSGFYRAGISRYTPAWGSTYTPFIDDEIAIVVENNRVIRHVNGGAAGTTAIPIPANGYLLVLRANASISAALDVSTTVEITSSTTPIEFSNYPNIIAAGPLILKNGQVVLDAIAEGFSAFFLQQTAIRSIIGTTTADELIIATIHNRVGGRGPTLPETAQLIQQLGLVNALNLDGGSSTSLYLGGQLLNRPPSSAARVHNGFAIALNTSGQQSVISNPVERPQEKLL